MSPTTTIPKPVSYFESATQYQALRHDIEAAVREVLESQQFVSGATSGRFVGGFEESLGRFLSAHVVGLSSGTDAILAALMAIDVQPGDEVITTPFTFFATAGCISRLHAKTVFVDIDPATFLIDPSAAAAAITPKTAAIIPVHLYGQMVDSQALSALAAKAPRQVHIIEDACQAIGARDCHGHSIGQNATAACLSFYPTKNLGAAGDAGAVVTRAEPFAQRLKQARQHGETSRYQHEFVGGNFRMDALQAAVLNVKLRYLEQWNRQRQAIAAYYTSRFAGSAIIPPAVIPGANHVFNLYTIRTPKRDALRDHLVRNNIGCGIYYPKPLHLQACFADLGYKPGAFPQAEKTCAEVLSLPIFPELSEPQYTRVADTVLSFFH